MTPRLCHDSSTPRTATRVPLTAVREGDDVGQASDDRDRLLVALPREVDDWAAAADMNLDVCVMQSLRDARAKVDCGGAEALRLRDAPADQVERA